MIEALIIIIFLLAFVYIAWHKLDWAIILCLVLLPTYLLRFDVWFIPMSLLEVMLLALFIVWLVKVLSSKSSVQSPQFKVNIWWPWRWGILFFVLAGILAVIISPDVRQALGLWKAYILEPVLFFIVFVNTIKTRQQLRGCLWAFGVAVTLIGFGALLQYVNLADIPAPYGQEAPKRATSIFPFPTAIGKFVGPLLALFFGLWLVTKNKAKSVIQNSIWQKKMGQFFLWGVIVFGIIGLLFSVSRGAMIGVFAGLVFVSFFSHWRKWIWFALLGLVLITMLIPQTRDNITSVFKASDVSTDVRLVMWQGAWRIIEDNIIMGTGLASFPEVYDNYKEASHTEYFPNPDHLILTLWIEMGLAGLLAFMWLVVRFFVAGVSIMKKEPIAVALVAAMIAIIIHGFMDTPYFKNDLAVQWWALAGMMVVLKKISSSDIYKHPQRSWDS